MTDDQAPMGWRDPARITNRGLALICLLYFVSGLMFALGFLCSR